MEQDPGGNGHVGVVDLAVLAAAEPARRAIPSCLSARVRPELRTQRRGLQKGHLCTSPR